MPRYLVVQEDDRLFLILTYRNFRALGAPVEPLEPRVAIPLHENVSQVVAEADDQARALERELRSMGVGRLEGDGDTIGYEQKLNFPFRFFRGEADSRFSIMPTRYRFTGQTDPAATVRERIDHEDRCAGRMRAWLTSHGATDVSDEQARAAARHHGAPSSFVDFTFEPAVAAFFAHPAFAERERAEGAPLALLYSLGIGDFESLFGMAAWGLPPDGGRDIHYLNVAETWRIPYRSFDPERKVLEDAILTVSVPPNLVAKPISIRTRLVPAVRRIVAQQGIFLDASVEGAEDWWSQVFLWTVLDFASRKWAFRRQDFQYENPATGVTADRLFPPMEEGLATAVASFA